ncbi:hypothetical protein [Nocardia inohanensis]|uniref:hypothetical protein n=1 Tax=Nocardia inohanensis TaxID=209246 RepID=UPI0008334578|nr:hypothetical protein [Nocardia inohanensis]
MSVLAGAPLHSTVIAALRTAGARISHAVDTRDLLVALIRVDEPSRWSRIEVQAGEVEVLAAGVALDPVNRSTADWSGIPLTGTCATALDIAERLARHYDLWPLPPGILALGLIADETSAAAMVLGEELERGELLRLIQDKVLGVALHGLDARLPGIVAEARSIQRQPVVAKPTGPRRWASIRKAAAPKPVLEPPIPPRPAPFGWVPPGTRLYCAICGSTPAAHIGFNRHQGLLLYMRFISLSGTFCRDCGLATYRSETTKSLWQGWWGPLSMFINGITVLSNLHGRSVALRLPPPIPGAPGTPLDPGRPLYRRPMAVFGLLSPILFVLAVGINIEVHERSDRAQTSSVAETLSPYSARIGDCFDLPAFTITGSAVGLKRVPCSDSGAYSEVAARLPASVTDDRAACSARGAQGYFRAADAVVCVKSR